MKSRQQTLKALIRTIHLNLQELTKTKNIAKGDLLLLLQCTYKKIS